MSQIQHTSECFSSEVIKLCKKLNFKKDDIYRETLLPKYAIFSQSTSLDATLHRMVIISFFQNFELNKSNRVNLF